MFSITPNRKNQKKMTLSLPSIAEACIFKKTFWVHYILCRVDLHVQVKEFIFMENYFFFFYGFWTSIRFYNKFYVI